jgi:hypothetical protein
MFHAPTAGNIVIKADSYVQIFKSGASKTGRTEIWTVATRPGVPLGEIKWFPRWRQYAFFAHRNTWLSPLCMADIAERIFILNREQRAKKKRPQPSA